MCGICGVWLRDGNVDAHTLIAMRDAMAHRGPDGASGVLLSSTGDSPPAFVEATTMLEGSPRHDVALGHRRLAIIDIKGGNQPMASDDGLVWLVYNGEIYNYRELRRCLIAAGYTFRTESDTEVLLRAYEAYGTDCPMHLNGIFAFAIWDARTNRLFLARDHFGVKPLYYAAAPGGLVFGSEIKALLKSGLIAPEFDIDALGLTMTFRHTPSPFTLFRGVQKLPPGASMVVDGARPQEPRFYDHDRHAVTREHRDWTTRLAAGMGEAIHRQMVSDVPIGLSLSSGVDSSTLLAAMSRWANGPVRTFTIGFGATSRDDEVPLAERLAARYGAHFQARQVRADEYAEFMAKYMWHLEEPIGNESAQAYYFVAEMARDAGVKVLLTGQGPDELFAGYDRHAGVAFARLLSPAALPLARGSITRATQGRPIGEKFARFVASASAADLAHRLLGAYTVMSQADARALLRPEVYDAIDWSRPLAYVEEWLRRAPPGTPLERMLWIDARTLLTDNLLLAEDKMAMAASVEARVPFLDVEFARLAESVPGAMKLRLGRRKYVYRRACERWVGARNSRRRKIPFANPMADWFRGPYSDVAFARLGQPDSFLTTHGRPEAVQHLVSEHRQRVRDHTRKLYFLSSLEAWHDTFFN